MSLNKTLDRLFDEIRREAKRNPDFANRLDAAMRAHASRRDVPEEAGDAVSSPACGGGAERSEAEGAGVTSSPSSRRSTRAANSPAGGGAEIAPTLSPVGLYQREGEEALFGALEGFDLPALRALVAEHNLDPSAEAGGLDRDSLLLHILAQAKRRAERDAKMFDY